MEVILKCSNCQENFKRSQGFYMYKYKCCSDKCLRSLRDKDKKIEKIEKNPVRNIGAFTLSSGGYC